MVNIYQTLVSHAIEGMFKFLMCRLSVCLSISIDVAHLNWTFFKGTFTNQLFHFVFFLLPNNSKLQNKIIRMSRYKHRKNERKKKLDESTLESVFLLYHLEYLTDGHLSCV